ncbi:MAG: hypothetical protein ACYTXC_19235 [Nostoc sp.]
MRQNYLIGKPLIVFIAEPDRQTLMNHLANLQQVQDCEVYLNSRGGTAFTARIKMLTIQNSCIHAFKIQDISDVDLNPD